MSGPYAGLRVLDLSHVIAGPFCARLLADMGADVIRVEAPRGDMMRAFPVRYGDTLSSGFSQYNNGKKSVCIDLKKPEGRDLVLGLVETSDVVIENLSPGAFERLGLGYEVLRARKADIILCSLSAFGAEGPYAHLSGYGLVSEAYSGLMSLTGDDGGSPMHFGTPLADMNAAVHGFAAIGAALHHRAQTGAGTHIDLSSFDALFAMIDQAVGIASFSGGTQRFERYGTMHGTSVPSGVVRVADGQHVAYAAMGDGPFAALADEMGMADLLADPRFATFPDRIANRLPLYALIRDWAATQPSADRLVERLIARGISAARVRTVEENIGDAHLLERGTLQRFDIEGVGPVVMQVAPYRLSGCEVRAPFPARELGADTDAVLRDRLGLDDRALAALREAGAIRQREETA